MNITYDPEANAAYLALKEDAVVAKTVTVTSSVLVDFEASGEALGVELLYPARKLPLEELKRTLNVDEFQNTLQLWKGLRDVLNTVENRKREK